MGIEEISRLFRRKTVRGGFRRGEILGLLHYFRKLHKSALIVFKMAVSMKRQENCYLEVFLDLQLVDGGFNPIPGVDFFARKDTVEA